MTERAMRRRLQRLLLLLLQCRTSSSIKEHMLKHVVSGSRRSDWKGPSNGVCVHCALARERTQENGGRARRRRQVGSDCAPPASQQRLRSTTCFYFVKTCTLPTLPSISGFMVQAAAMPSSRARCTRVS